jgi:hypothetical protein
VASQAISETSDGQNHHVTLEAFAHALIFEVRPWH